MKRKKQPPEAKFCQRCARVMTWRKQWESDWEKVRYCSQKCRSQKLTALDRKLEEQMERLLEERGPAKTICPSEVSRLLEGDQPEWRVHNEAVRMAARRLVAKGRAVMMQQGQVVDPSTARGPIRVRLQRRSAP